MNVTPVSHILEVNDLLPPVLSALVPSVDNYRAYLIQPHGEVEGSIAGVWNRNREAANHQFSQFLSDAINIQPDLVITPEYSLPWDVLVAALNEGKGPAKGKLWVLGCESIKYVGSVIGSHLKPQQSPSNNSSVIGSHLTTLRRYSGYEWSKRIRDHQTGPVP